MSQVQTCDRRGVTCDTFSVTCSHMWHRSLNMCSWNHLPGPTSCESFKSLWFDLVRHWGRDVRRDTEERILRIWPGRVPKGRGLPPHPDGATLPPPGKAPKCITRVLLVRCSAAKYPSVQGTHSDIQWIHYSSIKYVGANRGPRYGLPSTQVHEEPLICK